MLYGVFEAQSLWFYGFCSAKVLKSLGISHILSRFWVAVSFQMLQEIYFESKSNKYSNFIIFSNFNLKLYCHKTFNVKYQIVKKKIFVNLK